MEKIEENVSGFTADGNQFLTFTLGAEEYGIEILKVQEIKGYSAFTPIPNAPAYIKGVMNLRGTVVPVVDLRTKFAMNEAEYNQFTVVIVVTVGSRVFGLVVDAVSDVLNIPHEAIEATPRLGAEVDTSFMKGMAKANDKLIALLDIDQLLGEDVIGPAAAAN